MSNEQPTPVRLLLSFPGSQQYAHDAELPADWYQDSRYSGLNDYVQHQLLPEALFAAGLAVKLDFPEGVSGITADAVHAGQELPADGPGN